MILYSMNEVMELFFSFLNVAIANEIGDENFKLSCNIVKGSKMYLHVGFQKDSQVSSRNIQVFSILTRKIACFKSEFLQRFSDVQTNVRIVVKSIQ